MLDGAQETLTRKIGPLPVYAWAGVGVLGFVAFRVLTGGGGGQQTLGQITDANPVADDGGGGGDGVSHSPVGTGGTGTVGGNGTSYTTLTVTGSTKTYGTAKGIAGKMLGLISPS